MDLFDKWCTDAVSKIRYRPDRQSAYEELKDHLEDRYDALIQEGHSPEEARFLTLEAMGSAEEIAPQLGHIHKPFGAWYFIFSKWILAITTIFCVLSLCQFTWRFTMLFEQYAYDEGLFHPYEDVSFQDEYMSANRRSFCEPNITYKDSGYTLTMTRSAFWDIEILDILDKEQNATSIRDTLYFQIQISNPLPWAEFPSVEGWLWARDSLGNYYYARTEAATNSFREPQVYAYRSLTGLFTHTVNGRVSLTDQTFHEIEWIEICYDRDGRDMVFRIDMTGGDEDEAS